MAVDLPPSATGPLRHEFGLVLAELDATSGRTAESLHRTKREIRRFADWMEAEGFLSLRHLTEAHVRDFLYRDAVLGGGSDAPKKGPPLMRRDAVRETLPIARRLGLVHSSFDPTADLVLGPPNRRARRPLTDEEELLGRAAADRTAP